MTPTAGFWTLLALLIFFAAAALCTGLIVVLFPLLKRYALAKPNARSSHREPTPQGGGIAVVTATVAVVMIFAFIIAGLPADQTAQLLWVLGAAAFIAGGGVIDDMHGLPVLPRLLLQAVAIALVLTSLPVELRVVPALPWWIERA